MSGGSVDIRQIAENGDWSFLHKDMRATLKSSDRRPLGPVALPDLSLWIVFAILDMSDGVSLLMSIGSCGIVSIVPWQREDGLFNSVRFKCCKINTK